MEIVVSWQTLIMYARELGQARLSGDPERIREAKKRHDDYVAICKKADRMILPPMPKRR